MVERAVVNASPLIFLARAGLIDMLRILGDVVVPSAVASEVEQRGPDDPTVRAIKASSWIEVIPDLPVSAVIRSWDLGDGESAVLAWAQANPGTEAVIDDLAGRRCAASLQIPVRGTLGLVLLAKMRGLVPLARPVLEALRQSGMRLSDAVLDRALANVGE